MHMRSGSRHLPCCNCWPKGRLGSTCPVGRAWRPRRMGNLALCIPFGPRIFLTICKETHASINLSLPPQLTKGSLDSPTRSLRQLYYWLANWLSACFRRVGQPSCVSCFLTHRRDTASNISARLLLQLLAVSFSLFVPGSSHRWSFVQLYRTLRSLPESRFLILLVPARTKHNSFPSDRPNGISSRSHCSRYCCQPHPSKLYTFGAGTQVALLSLSIGKTILNRMLQKPIL